MQATVEVAFGPYRLDSRGRSLFRGTEPVGLSPYEFGVLHLLVRRPNVVLSKDVLIRAGWNDTAVGDNSLEKLVSKLRRHLDADDLNRYIRTVPRQGYQFVAPVTAVEGESAATDLELLLAPHRAWTEGRVALESLQCERVATARTTFQQLTQQHPGDAAYQIGLADACVMQFEASRTDPMPDVEALKLAESHARQACRLDPDLAEAWATLGVVLERTGRRADALAALERAVALEPDNWRHQVRLALGSWGETRLRAARRALAQCPQLPLAHWLAATVFVARGALDQAERDVDRALAVAAVESPEAAPYSMVALHWLKGLLRNAAGATADAMASFDQELAFEARGHLYAREAAANTWYARRVPSGRRRPRRGHGRLPRGGGARATASARARRAGHPERAADSLAVRLKHARTRGLRHRPRRALGARRGRPERRAHRVCRARRRATGERLLAASHRAATVGEPYAQGVGATPGRAAPARAVTPCLHLLVARGNARSASSF